MLAPAQAPALAPTRFLTEGNHAHRRLPQPSYGFECGAYPYGTKQEIAFLSYCKREEDGCNCWIPEGGKSKRRDLRKTNGGNGGKGKGSSGGITVPVCHFAYSDNGDIYVTDAQIEEQMRVLNEAFEGTGFEFEMAQDTTRITDAVFDAYVGDFTIFDDEIRENRCGCMETLNVFWMDLLTVVEHRGIGFYPGFEENLGRDSVIVTYQSAPFGEDDRNNLGNILIHEVGHWLNVLHP